MNISISQKESEALRDAIDFIEENTDGANESVSHIFIELQNTLENIIEKVKRSRFQELVRQETRKIELEKRNDEI